MTVTLLPSMILGSFAAGAGLLCLRPESLRRLWVAGVTLVVACGALALALAPAPLGLTGFPLNSHWLQTAMMAAEIGMAGYVIALGLRARRPLVVVLMLVQAGALTWFEWSHGSHLHVANNLYLDKLSVVMALINGLVGGGICLYALGYMRDYHQVAHREVKDRRPFFFSLLFVFMGAMFGIVFANNLLWLFFFWEVTTLCSFLLIGYSGTAQARENAFRALTMNLTGGVAFALGIVWLYQKTGDIELQKLIASNQTLALAPAALLCFAGITKSAQMPFSGWLLGAMVAPTPVSALLHSSTMVKAGVYLVLRLAPVITGTTVGLMVALVGCVTFLVGSLAAITTSDAKKVLAYSTVANLGLIVLCGGVGTYAAVWAGMLLLIFHALAKCLLFLCVGVVEQKINSRDIESMSGLILNMPKVAVMMLIGMAGMFLAPFGMLISKWAVLKALIDTYPLLTIFIVFGSSATLFFWVKWMGKLLEVVGPHTPSEKDIARGAWVALYGLAAGTFLACLLFPLISAWFIEPYVMGVYGHAASLGQGNIIIMMIMMALVMLFPASFLNYGRGVKVMDAYLGGANAQSSVRFLGSGNVVNEAKSQNYYLRDFLDETALNRWGSRIAALLLGVMLVAAMLGLSTRTQVRQHGHSAEPQHAATLPSSLLNPVPYQSSL
jgi:ech hydrogenase subunit A